MRRRSVALPVGGFSEGKKLNLTISAAVEALRAALYRSYFVHNQYQPTLRAHDGSLPGHLCSRWGLPPYIRRTVFCTTVESKTTLFIYEEGNT